jgi:hypothetical protein
MKTDAKTLQRVYKMSVASVYPFYIQKAEKKGRTKKEVDEVTRWLTGYSQQELDTRPQKQDRLRDLLCGRS